MKDREQRSGIVSFPGLQRRGAENRRGVETAAAEVHGVPKPDLWAHVRGPADPHGNPAARGRLDGGARRRVLRVPSEAFDPPAAGPGAMRTQMCMC